LYCAAYALHCSTERIWPLLSAYRPTLDHLTATYSFLLGSVNRAKRPAFSGFYRALNADRTWTGATGCKRLPSGCDAARLRRRTTVSDGIPGDQRDRN
jgi:hypothetical protein